MRPVVTPAEMAEADRRVIAAGTPEAVLVERAGRAVARRAVHLAGGSYARRAVVVCGKGNNGADGHVAARVLRTRGFGVDELDLADGLDDLERAVARADVGIDAMFGTGFRGALEGAAARAARALSTLPTVAVDIPSGVDGLTGQAPGPAVRAAETVCFAAYKPGLLFEPGRSLAGTVHVVDIGIDLDVGAGGPSLAVPDTSDVFVPSRDPSGHKWSTGLFVFGGSTGLTGAPMMAARAGARCGAGTVVCGLPGRDAAALASGSEIITRALPATSEGTFDEDAARAVLKELARFGALAVGPGLGRDDRAHAAARRLVAEAPCPVVVDADALTALAADPAALRVRQTAGLPCAILTPHAGEYERLAGHPVGADRVDAARELARRVDAIVVLKGPGTVVAEPNGRAVINPTDSAALATAGSGDVLTGIIGGLLANGADPFTAATSGAFIHGCAAHTAGTAPDLVATDLIGALHPTLEALRRGRESHGGDDARP